MLADLPAKVFVLDNGSYAAKVGYASDSAPKIIPNYITKAKSERRRIFVGSQLDECKDLSGLFYIYPTTRGYIVHWDYQKQVWDHILGREMFNAFSAFGKCSHKCSQPGGRGHPNAHKRKDNDH